MKKLSILAILLAFLFVGKSFAQPQVTVHVTGGYNLPLPDLKGDYPGDVLKSPTPYFMKNGFNAGADVKYYLGKKRNVGITFSGAYNGFSSGDITATGSDTAFFRTANDKINIITLGLGIEYAFLPKGKANPFIGVEFTGNFFSGKDKLTSASGTTTETSHKSESRFGIQGNLGVDIMLNKNIGLVVGAKYDIANLINKDSAGTSTEPGLFDKETSLSKARNIQWLGFYGGVSFYFNRPKMRMKK